MEDAEGQLLVLSGSDDKTVRLWRGLEGAGAGVVMRHDDWVYSVAFLPKVDDAAAPLRAVSGSRDFVVKIWEVATGELVFERTEWFAFHAVATLGAMTDGTLVPAVISASGGLYMVWTRGTVGDLLAHITISIDALLILGFAWMAVGRPFHETC